MSLEFLWRRGHRVLAALIAALLVGLSGGSHQVSAQTTTYTVIAVPVKGLTGNTACTGEDVLFQVYLYEHFEGEIIPIVQMVNIDALNTGGRGSFLDSSKAIGASFIAPDAAFFIYTPESEGEETVYFETNVPPDVSLEEAPIYASSAPLNFAVDDCPYEIEGVYDLNYEAADGRIAFFGLIPLTELTPEDLFGQKIHSADSLFLGHFTTWNPSCVLTVSDLETTTEIVAVPEGETLLITVTYKPAEVVGQASCDFGSGPPVTQTMDFNSLEALKTFRVPIGGGTQVVQVNEYATMTVTVNRKRGGN